MLKVVGIVGVNPTLLDLAVELYELSQEVIELMHQADLEDDELMLRLVQNSRNMKRVLAHHGRSVRDLADERLEDDA